MQKARRVIAGAFVGALVLCSCSNMSGTAAQQVREWANGAGYASDLAQLNSDLTSLKTGVARHDLNGVRTECAGFGIDAETLDGELPTPIVSITDDLDAAMSSFYNAGTACYNSTSFSSRSFAQYKSYLAKGERELDSAKSQLKADGVG